MSSDKVWWLCIQGHEWRTAISHRALGGRCPYCLGRLPTPERNLAILFPHLEKEWAPLNPTPASAFTPGSKAKVLWQCAQGHEWQAVISDRVRGKGCLRCTGRVSTPERNLEVVYPALAHEWSTRNTKPASAFTPGSGARVWWQCIRGHQWQAIIGSRAAGHGCPYCSGRRPTQEYNLATDYPALLKEWSPLNQKLAVEFTPMSHTKVWWRCVQGHDWLARIEDRSLGGQCPYCVGRIPSPERNLSSVLPEVAKEWSPLNQKSASEVTPRARTRVWWLCARGHSWQATVCNRARGSKCPYCQSNQTRSAPEIALVDSLVVWLHPAQPSVDSALRGLRWPSGITINPDFAIAEGSIKFVVEYDGQRFHSTRTEKSNDLTKNKIMSEAGFTVIRIREAPLPILSKGSDLVLDPTSIYQDRAQGFPYLALAAREHIDKVCRQAYGDALWDEFSGSFRPLAN